MQKINKMQKMEYIPYLKVLACLLITNSHCRDIYPVYFLAVGGGWGNALFFIIAGYCVAYIQSSFFSWYLKRVKRLLPATIMIIILDSLLIESLENLSSLGIPQLIEHYVNKYWFAFAILLYYAIYYVIFSKKNIKLLYISILLYSIGYMVIYIFLLDKTFFSIEQEGFSPFKLYFYFGILLIGGLIRLKRETIINFFNLNRKQSLRILILLIMFSIILWALIYILLFLFQTGYYLQFLVQFSVLVFAVSCMAFLELNISNITIPDNVCGKIITVISESTLEIYLIQVTLKKYILDFAFPLNLILFFTLAITGGIVFHYLIAAIFSRK